MQQIKVDIVRTEPPETPLTSTFRPLVAAFCRQYLTHDERLVATSAHRFAPQVLPYRTFRRCLSLSAPSRCPDAVPLSPRCAAVPSGRFLVRAGRPAAVPECNQSLSHPHIISGIHDRRLQFCRTVSCRSCHTSPYGWHREQSATLCCRLSASCRYPR